jgi:hypothetical protein
VRLEYTDFDTVYQLALRMRDGDYREFLSLNPATDREGLAGSLAQRYSDRPDVVSVWPDGAHRPVALAGLIEHRPNVISLLFFGTDDFPAAGGQLTRKIRKHIFPELKRIGKHRIEAVSMVGHDDAHRWIQTLGLQLEGAPMRGFGKDGEAFQQFSWVSDVCPFSG